MGNKLSDDYIYTYEFNYVIKNPVITKSGVLTASGLSYISALAEAGEKAKKLGAYIYPKTGILINKEKL